MKKKQQQKNDPFSRITHNPWLESCLFPPVAEIFFHCSPCDRVKEGGAKSLLRLVTFNGYRSPKRGARERGRVRLLPILPSGFSCCSYRFFNHFIIREKLPPHWLLHLRAVSVTSNPSSTTVLPLLATWQSCHWEDSQKRWDPQTAQDLLRWSTVWRLLWVARHFSSIIPQVKGARSILATRQSVKCKCIANKPPKKCLSLVRGALYGIRRITPPLLRSMPPSQS